MSFPYSFVRFGEGKEPFPLRKDKRLPKEQTEFLIRNENMKGHYLGECLDSCRWGSRTTVMYEMNIKSMVDFIKNWMNQNKENFQELWHEKNISDLYKRFELPFIDYKVCPSVKPNIKLNIF